MEKSFFYLGDRKVKKKKKKKITVTTRIIMLERFLVFCQGKKSEKPDLQWKGSLTQSF